MERLTLFEIARKLGYKDLRTVKRWCKNNGVMVLSDIGTKGKYVILKEFEVAWLRSCANYLRLRHGEKNWLGVFASYTQSDISKVIQTEKKIVKDFSSKGTERNIKGKVKGENEKRFFDDLGKILSDA